LHSGGGIRDGQRIKAKANRNKEPIPAASDALPVEPGEILTLIAADTGEYRRANDSRAVKKTLSIPSWLNWKRPHGLPIRRASATQIQRIWAYTGER
jgi:hypothetical protein